MQCFALFVHDYVITTNFDIIEPSEFVVKLVKNVLCCYSVVMVTFTFNTHTLEHICFALEAMFTTVWLFLGVESLFYL